MNGKPDDIPEDVWDAARGVWFTMPALHRWETVVELYARAIMAEREACAKIADEHARAKYSGALDHNGVLKLTAESIGSYIRERE